MRKTVNKATIQGKVYDKSSLTIKTVKNSNSKYFGQEFIGGSLDIATDNECLNIVTVYFTFVKPTFNNGKVNTTFTALKKIINEGATVIDDSFENAVMVSVEGSIELNDFYTNRNGEETLVSAKRMSGSFLNIVKKYKKIDYDFECDMLINKTVLIEADEEKNIKEDYLRIDGAAFDFRGAILPLSFVVKDPMGIQYFQSLEASPTNMTFTKVWGNLYSQTIVNKREEESAFGAPIVKEYTKTIREWVVSGASKPEDIYPIGDAENGITEDEIKKAIADREIYLADVKKRNDEYQASKTSGTATANVATAPAAAGGFNF